MTGPGSRSARDIAAQVLHRFDPAHEYAGPILDRLLDQTQERQRATDLVFGTIRNLSAIDAVISALAGRPTDRITPTLLSIMRVAAYELAYSPATPVYSVVDEAVKNAGRAGGKKQTGFVNAVLRQIVRHLVNRQSPLAQAPPRRTLIQTPETGCEFDTDFLPDPATSPAEYLSACFSLPMWLLGEWLDAFGPDRTRNICLACNRRPSLYFRVNPLRTTPADLLTRFQQAGVQAESVMPDMIRVTGPHAVTQLPGFAEGLFTVQDLSASQAVRVLTPQPGGGGPNAIHRVGDPWSILDLCAAPGTKTTQLAEATRDAARIIATDIDPERLERVGENITRLGLKSVTILPYAQLESVEAGSFDAVLLDAPCSNTGVLARRVEARFRLRRRAMRGFAMTQRALLAKAAGLVKPGGLICYSTCSIQRQENQDVREFLTESRQFELLREELTLPSTQPLDHDGAYVALLRRVP